jgi:hypothetical protein
VGSGTAKDGSEVVERTHFSCLGINTSAIRVDKKYVPAVKWDVTRIWWR